MRISMDGKTIRFLALLCLLAPFPCRAAVVEISGLLALSKSDFADGYRSDTRRYTGSIAFKFTQVSALEIEYTDSTTKTSFPTTLGKLLLKATNQAVTYRDQVYSFNWVQNLVSSKWIIQPYFVFGGGRMVRKVTIELNEYGYREETVQNVTSGTGGVGLRIFLTKALAFKAEAKTYVPNFQFAKWKENQMVSLGLSWAF
jgi:hypothetical protein